MASRKQERQLQQAREAGQIEPEMDTETGKMINPHNPEFITKRPWYLGESGPSLVHHSKQKSDAVLSMKQADEIVQQRWAMKTKVASGFRKVSQSVRALACFPKHASTSLSDVDCAVRVN